MSNFYKFQMEILFQDPNKYTIYRYPTKVLVTFLDGFCLTVLNSTKSGSSHLEFLHFWQCPESSIPQVIFFIAPRQVTESVCLPEGGESYLKEAELCQISENFYKYLAWNWEWRRFSNQSAKLRSLILALQLTELFVGRLKLTIPLHPQGLRRGNW